MSDHTDTPTTTSDAPMGEGLNIGGAPVADPIADPVAAPVVRTPDPAKNGWWWGTGSIFLNRRKTYFAIREPPI